MDGAAPFDRVSYEVRVADGPPDTWRVRRMELTEAIGEPYVLALDLVATEDGDDPMAWSGAEAELVIRGGDLERTVRGVVADVELRGATSDGRTRVSIRVVPAVALLGMRVDSRIFQQLGAHQVVGEVLGAALAGWGRSFVGRFTADHVVREYCVQYRESDLEFTRRLCEDEGLFCVFEQPDDEPERIVLLDDVASLPLLETSDGRGELALMGDTRDLAGVESVHAFEWRHALRPTGVVALDIDPLHPETPVVHTERTDGDPQRAREHYVHGGRRWIGDDAGLHAGLQLDALRNGQAAGVGSSNALRLAAGSVFVLTGYPPLPDVRLLVVRVVHRGDCPEVDRFDHGLAAPTYVNRFECVRADAPYRLPRRTARPRAYGPETATVTGPEGEEIHVDEHGRIKVAMHWDRSGRLDDTSSCWMRVTQSWAGPGFGAMVLPRVGMEVVVDFLAGDPDRPIVTGCVYNGVARPPHALPDEKTKTTLRTSSSPGGEGFNELTFEDRAGGEQVFLHAQRDLVEQVKRNETMSVGSDRSVSIGRHDTLQVGGDQTATIDGNQTITVHGGGKDGTKGTTAAVKGAVEIRVTEPGTVLIDAAQSITLQVGQSSIVMDGTSIKITAGQGAYVAFDLAVLAGAAGGATLGLDETVSTRSVAGSALTLDAAAKLVSTAGTQLALDDKVTARAALGAETVLDANCSIGGGTVTITAAPGSEIVLDGNATMTGTGEVKCQAGATSLTLDAAKAALQAPTIDMSAAALLQMVAALIKAN